MPRRAKAAPRRPLKPERQSPADGYRPYKTDLRFSEPSICAQCNAVFHAGTWRWQKRPPLAQVVQCPACRRGEQKFPLGFVHLSGDYFLQHQDEVLLLVEREAEREQAAHPLERLMDRIPEDRGMLLTTTGFHLARRLGEIVQAAHGGEVQFSHSEAEDRLSVYWRR